MPEPPRRVVTGHAPDGRSVILSDGPPPKSPDVGGGTTFHELWTTTATPAPIAAVQAEPTERELSVPPPPGGTNIRFVDLPPGASSPMHRTQTVDYGIVLEGEVHVVVGEQETALHAGDVVVQRGTDHAWQNRSSAPARMAFVLIDGAYDDDLRALLGPEVLANLMGAPPAS